MPIIDFLFIAGHLQTSRNDAREFASRWKRELGLEASCVNELLNLKRPAEAVRAAY